MNDFVGRYGQDASVESGSSTSVRAFASLLLRVWGCPCDTVREAICIVGSVGLRPDWYSHIGSTGLCGTAMTVFRYDRQRRKFVGKKLSAKYPGGVMLGCPFVPAPKRY